MKTNDPPKTVTYEYDPSKRAVRNKKDREQIKAYKNRGYKLAVKNKDSHAITYQFTPPKQKPVAKMKPKSFHKQKREPKLALPKFHEKTVMGTDGKENGRKRVHEEKGDIRSPDVKDLPKPQKKPIIKI